MILKKKYINESRDKKNYKNKPFYALETVIKSGYVLPEKLKEKIIKIFE